MSSLNTAIWNRRYDADFWQIISATVTDELCFSKCFVIQIEEAEIFKETIIEYVFI